MPTFFLAHFLRLGKYFGSEAPHPSQISVTLISLNKRKARKNKNKNKSNLSEILIKIIISGTGSWNSCLKKKRTKIIKWMDEEDRKEGSQSKNHCNISVDPPHLLFSPSEGLELLIKIPGRGNLIENKKIERLCTALKSGRHWSPA